MKYATLLARAALAILAATAWAMVYPFQNTVADVIWLVLIILFFCLAFIPSRPWQRRFDTLAAASTVAGVITLGWSTLAWRYEFWLPEFPGLLHRLFQADGEAAYNASQAQLFLVIVLISLAAIQFQITTKTCRAKTSPQAEKHRRQ